MECFRRPLRGSFVQIVRVVEKSFERDVKKREPPQNTSQNLQEEEEKVATGTGVCSVKKSIPAGEKV